MAKCDGPRARSAEVLYRSIAATDPMGASAYLVGVPHSCVRHEIARLRHARRMTEEAQALSVVSVDDAPKMFRCSLVR
jgi:hypothetical protein